MAKANSKKILSKKVNNLLKNCTIEQIEVEDYSTNEKIFYPPNELDVTNTPLASNGENGVLAYYEPWGDVVMFHDSFDLANDLYQLGNAIEGIENIENLSGEITIEKVEN